MTAQADSKSRGLKRGGRVSSFVSAHHDVRSIVIIAGDLSRSLEIGTMSEVFHQAGLLGRRLAYSVQVVASANSNDDSLRFEATKRVDIAAEPVDTLIILGPEDADSTSFSPAHLQALRDQCSRSRRVVAIAGGTLVLAATGLLDRKRAVTHWSLHDQLRVSFTRVLVQPDIIFTREGNVYTCAGGIACADLALTLVEEDLGSNIAATVARRMLLHFRRTGMSRQVSLTLEAQAHTTATFFNLLAWLPDHLTEDLSVESLARRAAMSPRNFARIFRQEVGLSPGKYVEGLRFEAAQRELAIKGQTISGAAELVGFTNVECLRRLFTRRLGTTPGRFREEMISRPELSIERELVRQPASLGRRSVPSSPESHLVAR